MSCHFNVSCLSVSRAGEVGRHAVHCSITREFDAVIADYHILDQILNQLACVNIRNNSGASDDMRRKFDTIKWTLKKVEELVYDISMQRGGGQGLTGVGCDISDER